MKRIPPLILFFSFLNPLAFTQEPKLILPIGHTLGVTAADFSPDGKRILTAALDNTAKIWHIESGRLLANLTGHTDTLVNARFSPNGKKIVTACEDGTAKIWDANSTRMLADLKGHKGKVFLADFSPDGKKIFTAAQDGIIKIWETETGKLLFDLKGHTQQVYVASFSRDGKKIISSSDDSTAKLWDAETGKMLVDFKGHTNEIWFVDLSPDGKKVITGSRDSTARIWDAFTGAILKDIRDHHAEVSIVRFSPDGKRFVTASDDGDVKLWDAVSHTLIANIKAKKTFNINRENYYPDVARAADFSPDSKKLLTIYLDSATNIWDANTGKLLTEVKRESFYVNGTFFSKDSKKFSLGLASGNAQVYDLTKGTLLTDLRGDANFVVVFNYNRDCNRILVVNQVGPLKLLDAETNRLIKLFYPTVTTNNTPRGFVYEFSQDGKKIIGHGGAGFTRVFDASTGSHLWDLAGDNPIYTSEDPEWNKIITASSDSLKIWNVSDGKLELSIKNGSIIRAHRLSANGKRVAAFSRQDSTTKIWDIQTGTLVSKLKYYPPKPGYPIFSPTGEKWFFYSDGDTTLTVWNANTGAILYSIKELNLGPATFSPDGKKIIINLLAGNDFLAITKFHDAETGMLLAELPNYPYNLGYVFSKDGNKVTYSLNDNTFATWDFEQKKNIVIFKGHTAEVPNIQRSPDHKKFVSASLDGTAKVWDAESGKLLLDLNEHTFRLNSAEFTPDGKKIVTISRDNTTKVWNAETGLSLYTFIAFKDEDYLVLDKYSHYDGTEAARKLLYFSCGTEIIELEQVKDQLWVPNLIERIENGETINAAKLSDLNICNLTPAVDTIEQSALQYRFRITPRLGGLGKTTVYVNGIEVKQYTPQQIPKQNDGYLLLIDKKEVQKYFVAGKENSITVKSLTAKNSISSRSVSINEKGNEKNDILPNLYAVVVGVSDYKGEELDLRFAAKDAMDIANAIDISAKKLLNTDGKEHVFIYKVHTGTGRDKFPEKNGIRGIFTEIGSKALPNDILMIFFAGHGVVESEKNQFYFLTADASGATVAGALKNVGISTEELAEWIKPQVMKAQKRILIFDACNSGQAIKEIISFNKSGKDLLAARGDDKGKQIKAIEKLNEKSGMFIMAASASDQKAYEIGKYNQGALTYSLLRAIKEQPDILEDRQFLNISRWFNAAEKSVNELARETGARQQPQIVSTTNFNIGLVDDDVRNKIVLPFEKPLVTRSDFRNTELRIDNLKLRTLVDKEIDDLSGNDNNALLLFSPEYDGVNVYAISGDYTIAGNDVSVSIILTKGGTEIKTRFEIKGVTDNTNDIAKSIAQKVAVWFKDNH